MTETVFNGECRTDRRGGQRLFIGEDHLALGKSIGANQPSVMSAERCGLAVTIRTFSVPQRSSTF